MQKTVEIVYNPEAVVRIGEFMPYVKAAVGLGIDAGRRLGVSIDKVGVGLFKSYEDPDYWEIVLTFLGPSDRGKRLALMDDLSGAIAKWSKEQPQPVQALFLRVASEVKPSTSNV